MESVWQQVLATVVAEFSDIPDVRQVTTVIVRLGVAVLLSGWLGWERERHGADAGLRTHMLVGLGAAMFVLVPQQAGVSSGDLTRVVQGVVSGIGFLGAGAILKSDDENRIRGLTTAASIWATSAIGISAGTGREMTALLSTVFAFGILSALHRIERRLEARRAAR
jgi:putative Mg2+ transporter-C (MgtC) family protein